MKQENMALNEATHAQKDDRHMVPLTCDFQDVSTYPGETSPQTRKVKRDGRAQVEECCRGRHQAKGTVRGGKGKWAWGKKAMQRGQEEGYAEDA